MGLSDIQPEWMRMGGSESKAHLLCTRDRSYDSTAFCGLGVNRETPWRPAPMSERCRLCLLALERFAAAAVEAPPTRLEDHLLVRVTRPASDDLTPLKDIVARDLAKHRSWEIEILVQPVPEP